MLMRVIALGSVVGVAGLATGLVDGGAVEREVGGADMGAGMGASGMRAELVSYLDAREAEFSMIPAERKAQLEELGAFVRANASAGTPVRLNFVCTHNSRRSHMSMLWAAAAAERLGLNVSTYSGGTETTAFNPRAVGAITRAGFLVEKLSDDANPVYLVRTGEDATPMVCFSKVYDGAPNPKAGFGAVMVCDSADESCPFVPGADERFAITYTDPKVSDGTKAEAETYDERSRQIAREMLYAMMSAR